MPWLEAYLDTSVVGALIDDDLPHRKATTSALFDAVARKAGAEMYISTVVVDEIMRGPERLVHEFQELTKRIEFRVLERTPEAAELAEGYLAQGVLPAGEKNDAMHLAMATVAGLDLVLSWNFEHMVNLARIRGVNGVNLILGYRQIDVRSPEEVDFERE